MERKNLDFAFLFSLFSCALIWILFRFPLISFRWDLDFLRFDLAILPRRRAF